MHPLIKKITGNLSNNFKYIVLGLFITFSAYARQENVSIESFQIVKVNSDSADIDIIGSNDGTLGAVCLGVTAKSKDGSIGSTGFKPVIFPIGRQIHISAHVLAPQELDKPQTDYLIVDVYPCGKEIILSEKFNWSNVWKDVHAKRGSGMTDDSTNYSKHPGYIFYNNMQRLDYEALDLLMTRWNDPRERDNNGDWKLNGAEYTVNYSTPKDWNALHNNIKRWRELKPKSASAPIVEAIYWVDYAWHIRGGIYNQDIDPLAMSIFLQRMNRAEHILKESRRIASSNPLWFAKYLEVAVATNRNERFIKKLYAEGIRKFPSFQRLYLIMADYYVPVLGGQSDWKSVDVIINQAVSLTSKMDGKLYYAKLYSQISHQQKIELDILNASYLRWNVMKESFEDLVAHYPSAQNYNDFAVFACRANDRETYIKVRSDIKDHVIFNRWPSNHSIDMCDHQFMKTEIKLPPDKAGKRVT
jgi:hypothetical protein